VTSFYQCLAIFDCCTNALQHVYALLVGLFVHPAALNYHVMRVTPMSFISKYMTECGSTACEAQLVHYLLELTLLEHDSASFPPR
jgi:hypothetical protein